MKQVNRFFLFLLFASITIFAFSEENQDLQLLSKNKTALGRDPIRITDSPGNRFIGWINYTEIDRNSNIQMIWAYEKYIVIYTYNLKTFRETGQDLHLVTIFEFNENYRFSEYFEKGNKILEIRNTDSFFIGIYDKFFLHFTSPGGIRMEVIDIETGRIIFDGCLDHNDIDFISENTVVLYKIKESPLRNVLPGKLVWTLYAYSFNLYTEELIELNKTIERITD
jgi:hypothetical protein